MSYMATRSASVRRASTAPASCMVAPSRSSSTETGTPPRSPNSAGRSRESCRRLEDATSHWRTLPFKWSSRLPALLLWSLGRHHTCSSVSDATHSRSRGQYCSSSFQRENSRKMDAIFVMVIAGLYDNYFADISAQDIADLHDSAYPIFIEYGIDAENRQIFGLGHPYCSSLIKNPETVLVLIARRPRQWFGLGYALVRGFPPGHAQPEAV